jgi:enamine deaminase RidA (YjgF/YER057c/UK114 family)
MLSSERSEVTTPDVRAPSSPTSLGVQVGSTVYLSGQVAYSASGDLVGAGDAALQAHQCFRNLRSLLQAVDADFDTVVKLTIYVTSMEYRAAVLDARVAAFRTRPFPATTLVEVSALAHPDLLVEVDAIAVT